MSDLYTLVDIKLLLLLLIFRFSQNYNIPTLMDFLKKPGAVKLPVKSVIMFIGPRIGQLRLRNNLDLQLFLSWQNQYPLPVNGNGRWVTNALILQLGSPDLFQPASPVHALNRL